MATFRCCLSSPQSCLKGTNGSLHINLCHRNSVGRNGLWTPVLVYSVVQTCLECICLAWTLSIHPVLVNLFFAGSERCPSSPHALWDPVFTWTKMISPTEFHQHSYCSETLAAGSQLTLSNALICDLDFWASFLGNWSGQSPKPLKAEAYSHLLIDPLLRVQDDHWQVIYSMTLWSPLEGCFQSLSFKSPIATIILF